MLQSDLQALVERTARALVKLASGPLARQARKQPWLTRLAMRLDQCIQPPQPTPFWHN